ncbi:AMP-binding protein, partial [Clostridioides difficile]
EGEKRVKDYLLEAKQKLVQAYENQEYPFEELVEEVNVKRDLSRNPLFDVMLVLQNSELEEITLTDIQVKPYSQNQNKVKFDMTINVEEVGNHLFCEMAYRSCLFRRETVEQMKKHYIKILREMSRKFEHRLKDIHLLEEEEKQQLLNQHTTLEYADQALVMERFESHAASHPEKIALIYENQTKTYRELNEEANQLARYFIDHGVNKESVVGIKMNRSMDMMVAIFAILKSGASYLPIGIDTPQARIDYMLVDS